MKKLLYKIEKEVILEIILFCTAIIIISLLWSNNLLLTTVLVASLLVGMKVWYKKYDIHFFIIGAIVGPLAEIVCIYFGTWTYANPSILGIPIWLPIVWGLATIIIKRIAETFIKIKRLKK